MKSPLLDQWKRMAKNMKETDCMKEPMPKEFFGEPRKDEPLTPVGRGT